MTSTAAVIITIIITERGSIGRATLTLESISHTFKIIFILQVFNGSKRFTEFSRYRY
jgi:hypothetical protein